MGQDVQWIRDAAPSVRSARARTTPRTSAADSVTIRCDFPLICWKTRKGRAYTERKVGVKNAYKCTKLILKKLFLNIGRDQTNNFHSQVNSVKY